MREQTDFLTRRSAMGTASATGAASVGARISLIACLLLGICGIALVLHCSGCNTKELQQLRGQVEALNEAVQQGSGCNTKELQQLRGQVEALNEAVQQGSGCNTKELQQLRGQVEALNEAVQQVQRSLAQLNGELPEDVRKEIDNTLDALKEKPPKNKKEAEQVWEKMTELVNGLSNCAVERHHDKLALVGWILNAICWKFEYQNPAAEQLSKALDEVDELLERGQGLSKSVDRIEPTLKETVSTLLEELECLGDDFQKRDFDALIEQVENKVASAKKAELESLYQRLKRWDGAWESDPERKGNVQKYLPQLHCRLILYELDELEGNLNDAANEGETVRSMVALMVALRVQSIANGLLAHCCNDQARQALKPAFDRAEGLAQQACKVLEDIRVRKVQNYQRWAFEQIKTYREDKHNYNDWLNWVNGQLSAFQYAAATMPKDAHWWNDIFSTFGKEFQDEFKELIKKELTIEIQLNNGILSADDMLNIYKAARKITGWKNDINKKIAALIASEAMVYYLLRIERELLEPPLAQLWQEVWNKGWNDLEGQREYRDRVGRRSTEVLKVRPEDLCNRPDGFALSRLCNPCQ